MAIDMGPVMEALQAAVIAAGTKELAGAAADTAKGASKSTVAAGGKVLGWLRGKLTGFHGQGLDHACEKPEEPARWTAFEAQLRSLMAEDEAFAQEFAALVKDAMPEAVGDVTVQTAKVGDGAKNTKIVQIKGSGNQVSQ